MAKSSKWGNIVFYKTKEGELRWFDPDKAKTPEGKAKIKAIRTGKQVSKKDEDKINRINSKINSKKNRDEVMEGNKKARRFNNVLKNMNMIDDEYKKWEKEENKNGLTNSERKIKNNIKQQLNRASNEFRTANNDAHDKERKNRDKLNIKRAQKKAQERAHANEIYENASSNKDEAKKYAKYLEVNKDGNIQAKGNDTKAYFNKIQGEKLNQKSAEAQAKKDKARARIEKMKADNKAMQEEIKKAHQETKLTNATGERKQKALDSLKRIKGSEDYRNSKKADAEQEKAMIKHARVMDDAHSTNKEMNDASRALRTANNEAVRHGANPKGFSTTQGRDSRDELNIERARKKAETRNHTSQIREIMNKEENGGLGGVMFPRNKVGDKNASFYEKYGDAVRPNPRKLDKYDKYQKGHAQNFISDGMQKTRAQKASEALKTKKTVENTKQKEASKKESSLKWSNSPYGHKQTTYKGYSIEDGLYKGKVSVSMGGEDVIFSSVKEAQAEIDKMSKPRKKRSAKSALKK